MKKTILLLLATFAIIIAGNYVASAQNLLTNPGMEDWTINGVGGPPDVYYVSSPDITAEQEATTIHGGTFAAKVTWTTTDNVEFGQYVPVTVGNNYQFSFWALDNDPGGRARVLIRWYDVDTLFLSGYYGNYSSDSPDWQQISSISQTAPPDAFYAKAEIRFYDVSPWPGSVSIYIDDALFEDVTATPAVITDAYAVSSTAIDIVYDKAITSVNNADFTLTGSASITFSTATIDGTNPKIVHLTIASSAMTGDITLDNINDSNNGSNYDFYAGIMPISFTNTNNPGGTMLNGITATFQGILSADDAYSNVWVSDAAGQYNGVMIFDYNFWQTVDVGDEIIIYAQRAIYNSLTELVNPELISTVSTGNTPYGPSVINGSDIEYTIGADTDPAEPWEGQLVKIETFTVDSLDAGGFTYWCHWSDAKADYIFKMGDNVDYHLLNTLVNVGQTYPSITGIVDWDYYENYYRINPRNQYDVEGSIAPATQLAIVSVNGGANPETSSNFSVVVQAWDVFGNPTLVPGDVNFTFTTDGGDLMNVDFVPATVTTGTIASGTSEVTVTGVQMSPAGTNVTITANDDAMVLTSGQSAPFDVIQGISYIVYQGFETSGDTWNYIPTPPPYNASGDVWDAVSSLSAITPAVGEQFWGMQDLDNGIGGGDFWHTIDLDPVDISSYGGVELSFQYYTIGFDSISTDTLGYVIEYDNGTTWGDPVFLISNTLGWATVTIPIPNGTNYVRLRLQAIQNGGSDYAGFDDVKMIETASNPPTKLAIISVNGGIDPYDNTDFEVIVQAQNAGGSPAAVASDLNFTLTTNGGDLGTVGFVGGTTTTGIITAGTNAVVLSGIQMAPAGTNVTITATDDTYPFGIPGLQPGISDVFNVVEFVLPEIIITEIMQNPADVLDGDGEWFEVFNNSGADVDMAGWTIKDDGSDSHLIASSLIVPSYGFAVLGINSDIGTNGGFTCDYQYSGFTLANGDDEVVLVFSDGVTEVDRVEYDGGPVWPDPTGSSMAYTGFDNEDNNDGTKWVWGTFRESSYTSPGSDRGSPGSNGFDQILNGGFKLDLKVFLESPFINADSMSNAFRLDGILPLMHPFDPTTPYYGNNSPAWQFSGYDTLSYIRTATVDWLLVELRDATDGASAGASTIVAQQPALLTDTGTIISMNGSTALSFPTTITNNMYIVIWSRNHLGIMSSAGFNPVDGDMISYDFSTGSGQVYGGSSGYKDLGGVWGMVSGDINGDKLINADDNTDAWATEAGEEGGYNGSNLNIDDQINNLDKNEYWAPNFNINSSVPD